MKIVRKLGRELAARAGPRGIRNTLKILRDPDQVVVRWWDEVPNWGDALNPVLVEHLTGTRPIPYRRVANLANRPVYSVVGSMLDGARVRNLVVWGSGFMHADAGFRIAPARVCAVRGPRTRELVLRQGLPCPEVYGDPALLYPRFYRPRKTREFALGVVPHLRDRNDPRIRALREHPDVLLIDVLSGVETMIDEMCRCRAIASSSLHGVIAADAFGLPSLWVEFSDRVRGGRFKYLDYLESVHRPETSPFEAHGPTVEPRDLMSAIEPRDIRIDLDELERSCPLPRA